MRGSILLILHFHGYDSSRERPPLPLCVVAVREQIGRQRRIKSVCQQDKLELHLLMTGDRQNISDCWCCVFYSILDH